MVAKQHPVLVFQTSQMVHGEKALPSNFTPPPLGRVFLQRNVVWKQVYKKKENESRHRFSQRTLALFFVINPPHIGQRAGIQAPVYVG